METTHSPTVTNGATEGMLHPDVLSGAYEAFGLIGAAKESVERLAAQTEEHDTPRVQRAPDVRRVAKKLENASDALKEAFK